MSVIRFLHTGHLRLGAAPGGLADSPGWLRELSAGAVRHAVLHLFETAAREQAAFILVHGTAAHQPSDVDPACKWLTEQFAPLRRRGMRLVTFEDSTSSPKLNEVFDIVLRPQDGLAVSESQGQIRLQPLSEFDASSELAIVSSHSHASQATCVWRIPNRDSENAFPADTVQPLSPSEHSTGGAELITANSETAEVTTRQISTAVLSYETEMIDLQGNVPASEVVERIPRQTDLRPARPGQTVMVDWVLNATIMASPAELGMLKPNHLLQQLRGRFQGGHTGIWPRSISFGPAARIHLSRTTEETEPLRWLAGESRFLRETNDALILQPGELISLEDMIQAVCCLKSAA